MRHGCYEAVLRVLCVLFPGRRGLTPRMLSPEIVEEPL